MNRVTVIIIRASRRLMQETGWGFLGKANGYLLKKSKPTAVLRNKQTGTCIQIATESFTRSDLSNAFEQGELYTNAGYVAVVDLDDLSAPPSEYTLLLGVYNRVTGEAHYADTGISLT